MNFRDWWQISCKRPLSASPGRALRLRMFWRCQSCPRSSSTNFPKISNHSESWIFNWVAAGRWLSGRCTASALITSRLSSQQSDHRNLGKPPHTKTAAFTLCNNGTASLLRAQCPMSSMAPLLSFSGNADSNFSKRQSKENVQLLRRRWYQIVKLLDMHILHFPGTCQYQIWRKETGKHRKIWTDLVGQKEICTCNLDYSFFVMLPMPSNLGIFPLLFLTLSVIRWFAMI